jgi:uncharacterized coiled-coil DUF342 family protein
MIPGQIKSQSDIENAQTLLNEQQNSSQDVSIDAVFKKLSQLKVEHEKLNGLKKMYVDIAKSLDEHKNVIQNSLNEIDKLVKTIDPFQDNMVVGGTRKPRSKNNDLKLLYGELALKLREGVHVTTKLIEEIYPEVPYGSIWLIFKKLEALPGIQVVMDGKRRKRLFMK